MRTAAAKEPGTPPPSRNQFWSLRLSGPDIENQIDIFLSSRIQGATTVSEHEAVVYAASERDAVLCAETARAAGLTCSEPAPVADQNWHAHCAELWEPIQIGVLTVRPVMDAARIPPLVPGERPLFLIPGTGFGTGHHATTRMLIELMQRPAIMNHPPARTLDLGTGSGILALAAALLFGGSVDAIDNDPMAIENAIANAGLNPPLGPIAWRVGTVQAAQPPYDLVCANLYAELLVQLGSEIRATLSETGILLLSGIRREECARVKAAFDQEKLVLQESLEADGWCGLLYEAGAQEVRGPIQG